MKTINELDSKVWFRTLKVIYIAFVIVLYAVAVGYIIGITVLIQDNKHTFAEEQKTNIEEQKINTEKTELIKELKDKGFSTIQISNELKNRYHKFEMLQLTSEQFGLIYGKESDILEKNEPKPEMPATLNWLFLIVPSFIFIAWLISQLVKWIFYYIVLGNIKPLKS